MPPPAETQSAPSPAFSAWDSVALPGNEDPTGAVANPDPKVAPDATAAAQASPADKPQVPGEEPAASTAPEQTPEAKAEAERAEVAKVAASAKVWAGQYKTPEELETAHSQVLADRKKIVADFAGKQAEADKQIAAFQDKIEELTILSEVGPEIKEPTDE